MENKLFSQAELPGPNFDKLFPGIRIEDIYAKQEAVIEKMAVLAKSGRFMDAMEERRFELVESFPANFYSDGIQQLKMALQMRQTVAIKRWQGDKDFTFTDLLSSVCK